MKVSLSINGIRRQVVAGPDLTLLDFLRDTLQLKGAKQSCDKKGQCGACTVLLNGKAVRSCTRKVVNLDGADVITVEGLGTPDNPHLIQEAFVLAGAVQCGFCTPGMIMATKGLLDKNPDPTAEEIKHALRHNLCRCTGYVKIIESVMLAGQLLRGERTLDEIKPDPRGPIIGVSHPRPSAYDKACGTAEFTADIVVPGAIELAGVRSVVAHADVRRIDTTEALAMPGVVGVMTAKDVRGTNVLHYSVPDRPLLCERVRCIGDPVAVVAADTREHAAAAAAVVDVEYDPLPVLDAPRKAIAEGASQLYDHLPNLIYSQPQIKGDAAGALAESAAVVEGRFRTQQVHQAPLETEATIAFFDGEGDDAQLVVIGRSINIHKHLAMLQEATGWENMRYEEAFVGGQFGIRIDVTTEGIAAAAAIHFRRPVRYVPSLAETLLLTPKRHSYDMTVKMGADADAQLTALTMDCIGDNGAYTSSGIVIINRVLQMLSSSYNIPNIDALVRLIYTNNPWGAAARGAGPPQAHFATESCVDMLARDLGVDPLEFRQRNSLRIGQTKSTGRVADEWPFPEVCDAIRPSYERALREAREQTTDKTRRGVGVAAAAFGVGLAGDVSTVHVELDADDGLTVFAAVADPGEGNDSMLTQLAADAMGLPLSKVRLQTRNTELTAANGPAAASRHTFMSGGALLDAIASLKKAMAECNAATFAELKEAGRPTRHKGTRKNEGTDLDPVTGQGSGFESQVHAVQVAEIAVDIDTGEVDVLKMTCAVDAGVVINPNNFIGQIQGGMDMGAGFALREDYVPLQTKDWVTFKYPNMRTAFDMDIIVLETPRKHGTNGSIGVGEMTMMPTAPAIINAIVDACGVRVFDLPATPEKIKAGLAALP